LEYSVTVGESGLNALTPGQMLFPDFLLGKIDRLLIGECKRAKCQAFITMDYKTIVKFRSSIVREDHVGVLTPSEWWGILKPWFTL